MVAWRTILSWDTEKYKPSMDDCIICNTSATYSVGYYDPTMRRFKMVPMCETHMTVAVNAVDWTEGEMDDEDREYGNCFIHEFEIPAARRVDDMLTGNMSLLCSTCGDAYDWAKDKAINTTSKILK